MPAGGAPSCCCARRAHLCAPASQSARHGRPAHQSACLLCCLGPCPGWGAVAHAARASGRAIAQQVGSFVGSCVVEVYSKKVSYQSGRPDLNRRPLDPQEVGLAVFTGQRGSGGPALGAPTCRSFGQMHSVWSQSGPKRSPGGLQWTRGFVAARLAVVTVLGTSRPVASGTRRRDAGGKSGLGPALIRK